MFPFKFGLLFPSIEMAKATVKKLNRARKRLASDIDPRELKRMQDELRQAQEDAKMQAVVHRRLFL